MARLLELVARGQAVSPETSAEMVAVDDPPAGARSHSGAAAPEATVANKTGNWENAAHDVAIVYGPRSTLVIAFLADSITDIDALYQAMSQAALAAYDLTNDPSFGASPNPPLPPSQMSSYASPVRAPAVVPASQPAQTTAPRPAAPTAAAPVPVDKPRAPAEPAPTRAAQPTSAPLLPAATTAPAWRPAPAAATPALAPAAKPTHDRAQAAPKPAEKPQQQPPAAPPALLRRRRTTGDQAARAVNLRAASDEDAIAPLDAESEAAHAHGG